MSKMRDKLRALHKPRPTEVPALTRTGSATSGPGPEPQQEGELLPSTDNAVSDHRPLTGDEAQGPARNASTRPPSPTRVERARELPERLSANERRAPMPDKSVIGTPNTVTSRGMAAWRKRRAETGSGVAERPATADGPKAVTAPTSERRGTPTGSARQRHGTGSPRSEREHARQGTRGVRDTGAPAWHRPARHLSELTPGHVRIAAGRSIFVARRHYPGESELAGTTLNASRHLPPATLAEHGLAPNAALAFLDIESSGLSGQQGSVPFMVGIATWQAEGLLADVITMHEPDDEQGALVLVTSLLATVDAIVTFNGHVFDLPFLRQRFAVYGLEASVLDLPHIDAYRVARRVLKGRKGRGAFKLTTLEQDLLGIVRDGDIPGSEAPPRWFQTQRDGEVARLLPLLEHNQHDIMTLPALLYALATWDGDAAASQQTLAHAAATPARATRTHSHTPAAAAAPERARTSEAASDAMRDDPHDVSENIAYTIEHRGDPTALLRRGLTAYREGNYHEAAAILEAAETAGLTKVQRWSALKTLAQVQDALGQTQAAEQTWRTLSELPSTDPLPLTRLVEIARERGDGDAANALAERARQRAPWWREE